MGAFRRPNKPGQSLGMIMDSGNAEPRHPADGTGSPSSRRKLQTYLRVEQSSKLNSPVSVTRSWWPVLSCR